MKARRFVLAAGTCALAVLWLPSPHSRAIQAQTHAALHDRTPTGALIKVVREATERFRDVKVAEADGSPVRIILATGSARQWLCWGFAVESWPSLIRRAGRGKRLRSNDFGPGDRRIG